MAGYVYPCAVRGISDDFSEHLARGSVNPGTDYTAGYGSPVYAPAAGIVADTVTNPSGSGGRMVYLDLEDGNGVDLLHLASVECSRGQHVAAGQRVGISGASGYGSDWYYGPHLHISIRDRHGSHTSGAGNFDFDAFMRSAGAPVELEEVTDMYGSVIGVVDGDGSGLTGAWFAIAPGHITNLDASLGAYLASTINVETFAERTAGAGKPHHWSLDTVQWDASFIAGAPAGTLENLYTGETKVWAGGGRQPLPPLPPGTSTGLLLALGIIIGVIGLLILLAAIAGVLELHYQPAAYVAGGFNLAGGIAVAILARIRGVRPRHAGPYIINEGPHRGDAGRV